MYCVEYVCGMCVCMRYSVYMCVYCIMKYGVYVRPVYMSCLCSVVCIGVVYVYMICVYVWYRVCVWGVFVWHVVCMYVRSVYM